MLRAATAALFLAALVGGVVGATAASRVADDSDDDTDAAAAVRIVHLPLDERFTTRYAFLNLATTTPFAVASPPLALLPHLKQFPPLPALHAWVDAQVPSATTMVVSSEMYLYGGLIASRSSNDTTEQVLQRLDALVAYKTQNPELRAYVSCVVMRIPAYNEDVEEPWYWGVYGFDLYTYSYYLDKFNTLHNASDWERAEAAKALVPAPIVSEFLWRRARNFNVTVALLHAQAASNVFARVWITLDDNAPYGLNIAEARQLRALVVSLGLQDVVNIYPGADEVQLVMLSRVAVDNAQYSPRVRLVFRDPTTVTRIPNYEGQPMIQTLDEQIDAAGGTIVNGTGSGDADVVLCVNNFSEEQQIESPNQPAAGSVAEYAMFTPYVAASTANGGQPVIGFADNRYSNGGDNWFGEYILSLSPKGSARLQPPLQLTAFAYAGWNTDGNALGTVIANALLLAQFGAQSPAAGSANSMFVSLRILEDRWYQANVRQALVGYVSQISAAYTPGPVESVTDLVPDLAFYERFIYKNLASHYIAVNEAFGTDWALQSVYFPWNRTFEIGLFVQGQGPDNALPQPQPQRDLRAPIRIDADATP